ncbi:cyclic nucleotide-binding protein [Achlya hypogyna]|uniref:Cyclic nucleotide-binding protein n=1 Tax=Achlya hypogyna TaxID=1202772 RepID=A0A1V9ZDU4_ACHHY|nr:cyclic nucleotide-binding protein [Achlya hypogyna]
MNVNARLKKSTRTTISTASTGSIKAKGRPKIAPPRIRQLVVNKVEQELQQYETGYSNKQLVDGGAKPLRMKGGPSLESMHGSSRLRRSFHKIKAKAASPKTYVIDPKSTWAIQWDVFMAVLIAYSGITVPLSVCFPGMQAPSGSWASTDNVVDCFFGVDMLRNFMMGYHDDQDQLVVNHREIAAQYLRTWFVLDFFSTFPLQAVVTASSASLQTNTKSLASIQLIRVLRVTRILKLTRLAKLQVFFKKAEDRFGLNAGMVRLVRLVMLVLFLSHVMACFFHLLGQPVDPSAASRRLGLATSSIYATYEPNSTWLVDNNKRYASDGIRYMYSLYWVMTTLAGVGFGDVHAVSISERAYAIFAMMIGASVFGFVIGSISSLLESMNTRAAAYQMKMMDVKEYIRLHKLPKELRLKLCRYFEHYLQRASLFDETTILGEVSLNLRNEIVHETCRDIFRIPAFKSINTQFVMEMAIHIKPLFLLAESVIAKERTVGREMYFLNSGIVSVCNTSVQGNRILLEVLSENTYFGEAPLLFYCLRENTYMSLTNCEMYTLLKEDFDTLLEEYPDTESVLTQYYDMRKKSYNETHAIMMQRYAVYAKCKDDPTALRRMEDLWPHVKIALNGKAMPIEQFPVPILRLLPHFLQARVSVFNSLYAKKVILDGLKPKYEKAFANAPRLQALIDPTVPWKLRWDIFLGLLIVYNVIGIPFQFAFQGGYLGDTSVDPAVMTLDYCVDGFFAIDILLSFRTGYFDDEGHLTMNTRQIAERYLKGWFWIDLVSTFPIGSVAEALTPSASMTNSTSTSYQNLKLIRFMRLARLLKLVRLLKLNRSVSSFENVLDLSPAAIRLLKLFVQVCFIAHLSACVFYFIGQLSQQIYGVGWIGPVLWAQPTYVKYIVALYFSFTTMATVGYGDILPVTPLEVIYVIFYMLLGASVFGYIIGSMSTLVDQLQTKGVASKEKMDRVKEYMKERNLPRPLRQRIIRYFDFYLTQKEISADSELVHELSDDLRTQLVMHLNKDVVSKIPFFARQDDACISYLMGILYQECFTPGEFVFREGEFGRHMYFLVRGTVEVVIHANSPKEVLCKVLSEGSYFGELAMLLNSKRSASIRCKTFGILYVLSRNGMDHIHSHYPDISNHIMKEIKAKLHKIQQEAEEREAKKQVSNNVPMKQPVVTEKALIEAYAKVDAIIVKLVNFYGDGDKSKHRAIATIISRLKKFDFDGQAVYDAPAAAPRDNARRQFAKLGRKLIVNMNAFVVEAKRVSPEARWSNMPSHADQANGARLKALVSDFVRKPSARHLHRLPPMRGPSLRDVFPDEEAVNA